MQYSKHRTSSPVNNNTTRNVHVFQHAITHRFKLFKNFHTSLTEYSVVVSDINVHVHLYAKLLKGLHLTVTVDSNRYYFYAERTVMRDDSNRYSLFLC